MKVDAGAGFALCLLPFVLLATANSAGYRYGASDLAFYGPAVMRYLEPRLFPRDSPVIEAQARLTLMDETVGTLATLTTANLPQLFLGLYLASLVLLAAGASLIGNALYQNRLTTAVLLAALTLRHAIAKSGTNTLEGYFHPRQLAFALGTIAAAAFLRERTVAAVCALAAAALLHPTTTLWFGVWLGTAAVVAGRPRPARLLALAAAGAALVAWAAVWGPLAGRLAIMDGEWLRVLADKDYLFPARWPASAWIVNGAYVPVIWYLHRRRSAAGVARTPEAGLVAGALVLAVVFLAGAMLNSAGIAIAIQLQPARVFWMLDLLAVVYVVWALADAPPPARRRPALALAVVLAATTARAAYVMRVEFPDRPLFQADVSGDWGRVMTWARTTPADSGWLADPNHAALYGTSVRMAAGRDVLVEGVKDQAIGMYDRRIALRTRDRLAEIQDFNALSAARARELAARYGLSYLITERPLALPLAFASGRIRIYDLR